MGCAASKHSPEKAAKPLRDGSPAGSANIVKQRQAPAWVAQLDDITLKCQFCSSDFVFTLKEQQYFQANGFAARKRCGVCLEAKRGRYQAKKASVQLDKMEAIIAEFEQVLHEMSRMVGNAGAVVSTAQTAIEIVGDAVPVFGGAFRALNKILTAVQRAYELADDIVEVGWSAVDYLKLLIKVGRKALDMKGEAEREVKGAIGEVVSLLDELSEAVGQFGNRGFVRRMWRAGTESAKTLKSLDGKIRRKIKMIVQLYEWAEMEDVKAMLAKLAEERTFPTEDKILSKVEEMVKERMEKERETDEKARAWLEKDEQTEEKLTGEMLGLLRKVDRKVDQVDKKVGQVLEMFSVLKKKLSDKDKKVAQEATAAKKAAPAKKAAAAKRAAAAAAVADDDGPKPGADMGGMGLPAPSVRPGDWTRNRRGGSATMPSKRLINDPERYKTVLCTTWINTGSCPYGLKCRFAHGKEELRNRPPTCGQSSPPQAEAAPGRLVPPSMSLPMAMPVASSSSHSLGAPMPQASQMGESVHT